MFEITRFFLGTKEPRPQAGSHLDHRGDITSSPAEIMDGNAIAALRPRGEASSRVTNRSQARPLRGVPSVQDRLGLGSRSSLRKEFGIRDPRAGIGNLNEITTEFRGEIGGVSYSRRLKRLCVNACSQVGLPSHFASTASIRIRPRSSAVPNRSLPRSPRHLRGGGFGAARASALPSAQDRRGRPPRSADPHGSSRIRAAARAGPPSGP